MRTARLLVLVAAMVWSARVSASASSTYVIAPGDSLWAIAQREHVSVAALEAANHLSDTSILQLGRSLVIPGATPSAPHTQVAAHARRAARVVHRSHKARPQSVSTAGDGDIQVARAIWAATHGGVSEPTFSGIISYNIAVRALAFQARITHTAMRYLGVPYMWGGTSLGGVDCSGFVWTVFHRNGIDLPRMADEQYAVSERVRWNAMRPGDLVFFTTYTSGVSHVGIYLGRGRFIHASASDGVRVDSLGADYYASRFVGAGRLLR